MQYIISEVLPVTGGSKQHLKREKHFRSFRLFFWLLLTMLHLVTSFHRVSFNVLAGTLTSQFALSGVGLSNLAAAYTYLYVLMQIPGGLLVDRLGPRRMAFLTGFSMAAGSVLIGLAPSPAYIFCGRMLIGFGGSVVLVNIFKFQASWFRPAEFATMSGFSLLISTAGFLLAATPLAAAVSRYGWRPLFMVFGFFTVLVALLCLFFVKDSPYKIFGGRLPVKGIDTSDDQAAPFKVQMLFKVLGNRRLLAPFLINFGTYGGFIIFAGTWGVSYLVHIYGTTVAQASFYMVFAYLGYMVAAPLAGLFSARLNSLKIPACGMVAAAVVFWLLLIIWPAGQIPLGLFFFLAFLIGIGGASSVLSFPMARAVSIPGYTGLVTALVNLGVFLGMAVLQPLFGFVLDQGWQGAFFEGARLYPASAYRLGFLLSLLFALIALAAVVRYRDKVFCDLKAPDEKL